MSDLPNPDTKDAGMTFDAWQSALIEYATKKAAEDTKKYIIGADFKEYYEDGVTPSDAWDEEQSCWN